jgi:hypothetical protein
MPSPNLPNPDSDCDLGHEPGRDETFDLIRPASPSEIDVVRLRRRVQASIASTRPSSAARYGLAVAAVLVGVVGIAFVQRGASDLLADPSDPVKVLRAADGSVQFDLPGTDHPVRIVRSDDPIISDDDVVTHTRARRYVDRGEQQPAGTVVFYRID